MSSNAIRDEIIRDLTEGVAVRDTEGVAVRDTEDVAVLGRGSGDESPSGGPGSTERVRAGVIGEIGTSDPIDPREARVLRAACAAQRETGTTLYVHLDPWGRAGHAG